jgi:hypothetical protein
MSRKPEKWILKIKIKTHPKVKTKIDKATKIMSIICAVLFTVGIVYLLIDTFLIKHTELPIPTQKEIDEICNNKNMSSYGYIIKYHEQTKYVDIGQTYIICKTPFPEAIIIISNYTMTKCCYPTNCYQARYNPKQCNCTYPIYCYD